MKKSQLKSLVKTIIKEMVGETKFPPVDVESRRREVESLVNVGGRHIANVWWASYDDYQNTFTSGDLGAIVVDGTPASDIEKMAIVITPTNFRITARIRGETDQIKLPAVTWPQVKKFIKQYTTGLRESTEPSIGGSYADQQTSVAGSGGGKAQGERDGLTDPMLNSSPVNENRYEEDFVQSMNDDYRAFLSQYNVSRQSFKERQAFEVGYKNGHDRAKQGY